MPRRAAAKLAERMRKGLGPAQVAAPAEAPSTRSPWSLATRPRGRSPLVPVVAHHSPFTLPPPPPDVASPISRLALGITPSATERRLPGVGEESPGADSLGEESPGADSPGEDSPESLHHLEAAFVSLSIPTLACTCSTCVEYSYLYLYLRSRLTY